MPVGRYAPSPSGDLHLGNLRTALVAWLAARSTDSKFLMRFEDLERSRVRDRFYQSQLDDLAAIGIDWDEPVVRQSDRLDIYEEYLARLSDDGLTYPCYCTRKEIAEATAAAHGAIPHYPGTCRHLSGAERRRHEASGRPPALRLLSDHDQDTFVDRVLGPVSGAGDDVVLRRNDGTPAYNLVVVIDDSLTGVGLVVRGDDLAPSTHDHRQIARALGLEPPDYAHVPLVLGPDGQRLAKRDGSVTLAQRRALGDSPETVAAFLLASLGIDSPEEFSFERIVREPLRLSSERLARPLD